MLEEAAGRAMAAEAGLVEEAVAGTCHKLSSVEPSPCRPART